MPLTGTRRPSRDDRCDGKRKPAADVVVSRRGKAQSENWTKSVCAKRERRLYDALISTENRRLRIQLSGKPRQLSFSERDKNTSSVKKKQKPNV